ncbi:MAG: DUF4043 family protein, partial [Oxalobacteraceae bacterium]
METKLHNGLVTQKWLNKFIGEYVSGSGYKRYMGTADTSIIRIVEELKTGGETLNVPISLQIKGRGVRGDEVLSGNETVMGMANDRISVRWIRQAVKITKNQTFKTTLDLFGAARARLRDWFSVNLRNELNDAMRMIIVKGTVDEFGNNADTKVRYESADAGQLNGWFVANRDRIQLGAADSTASTNWTTALGTLS